MPLPSSSLITGRRREFSIGQFFESRPADPTMPEERRLLCHVLPPWQRAEVWSVDQQRRFVESIFYGLETGNYVSNGQDWDQAGQSRPMSGWLIDGQQRIAAIRDFVEGKLIVFGDVTYPSMTKPQQLRFMRHPFPCFELEYTDNEDALKELHDCLNFGGTHHTEDQRAIPGSSKLSTGDEGTLNLLDIEFYLNAAKEHGEDSDPDHEVGDLQDLLRVTWSILTADQKAKFALSPVVSSVMESALAGGAAWESFATAQAVLVSTP